MKIRVKIKERLTKHKGITPILIPKRLGKITFKDLLMTRATSLEEPEEKIIKKIKTIKPRITKGQAINIASPKRSKKYVLFGRREDIKYVELQLHPMVYIEIKQKEGILKKKFSRYSFIIDGLDGSMVDLEKGLRRSRGFNNLIGLNETEIKTLLMFADNDVLSAEQIKDETKISLRNVKAALKRLEKKNMVDYSKANKCYTTLVDIREPNIKKHQSVKTSEIQISAKPIKTKLKESNLKDIIEAIAPKSDILQTDLFYYPIYAVHFEKKIINIDALTGKEVA